MIIDGVEIPDFLVLPKYQQEYADIINAARREPAKYWHDETRTVNHNGVEMPASYSEAEMEEAEITARKRQQDPEGYWGTYLAIAQDEKMTAGTKRA